MLRYKASKEKPIQKFIRSNGSNSNILATLPLL